MMLHRGEAIDASAVTCEMLSHSVFDPPSPNEGPSQYRQRLLRAIARVLLHVLTDSEHSKEALLLNSIAQVKSAHIDDLDAADRALVEARKTARRCKGVPEQTIALFEKRLRDVAPGDSEACQKAEAVLTEKRSKQQLHLNCKAAAVQCEDSQTELKRSIGLQELELSYKEILDARSGKSESGTPLEIESFSRLSAALAAQSDGSLELAHSARLGRSNLGKTPDETKAEFDVVLFRRLGGSVMHGKQVREPAELLWIWECKMNASDILHDLRKMVNFHDLVHAPEFEWAEIVIPDQQGVYSRTLRVGAAGFSALRSTVSEGFPVLPCVTYLTIFDPSSSIDKKPYDLMFSSRYYSRLFQIIAEHHRFRELHQTGDRVFDDQLLEELADEFLSVAEWLTTAQPLVWGMVRAGAVLNVRNFPEKKCSGVDRVMTRCILCLGVQFALSFVANAIFHKRR